MYLSFLLKKQSLCTEVFVSCILCLKANVKAAELAVEVLDEVSALACNY